MKKIISMLLVLLALTASAQKITIKTGNGQAVEISCEQGILPQNIVVSPDGTISFGLKRQTDSLSAVTIAEATDSLSLATENVDSLSSGTISEAADSLSLTFDEMDSLKVDSVAADNQQSVIGMLANSIAEKLSPEYAEFNQLHENDHPVSERQLLKSVAKQFIAEDDVENIDLIASLIGSIRFTKDSTFVPSYLQRKPKNKLRTFDIIELSGNLGRDINNISDVISNKIDDDDYGTSVKNEMKYGGGIKYSRVYMPGKITEGNWKANSLGFAWSWGGLISYAYEKDMGSNISAMSKFGIQIGQGICIGLDALLGAGLTPYNVYFTNGMNYNLISKSKWCFKYGLQAWGSLNFAKNTYTAIFGRFIHSVNPGHDRYDISKGWDLVCEDFDPGSWTVGLAVGYKFGAPQELSSDKRLKFNVYAGGYFVGEKGLTLSAELERINQVSKSTWLTYGLVAEKTIKRNNGLNCFGLMFSTGMQAYFLPSAWFWGAKLYGGFSEYSIENVGEASGGFRITEFSPKLCGRGMIELSSGLKIGKISSLALALRAGYHIGLPAKFEEYFPNVSYTSNNKGFDMGLNLKYGIIF